MLKTRFPVGNHLHHLSLTASDAFALPLLDRAGPLYCETLLRLLLGTRASFRGRFGNRDCMVKVFFSRARHKHDCTTELNGLARLASSGCRVPEIVYVGPSSDQAASVLVLEWLADADNIAPLFARSERALQQQWLTRLTLTLARQHTAGCLQHDIDCSNFLALDDDIVCLDGERVQQQSQPVSRARGDDNLARFCAQWPPCYDDLLHEAVNAYARARFGQQGDPLRLLAATNRYRRQQLQQHFDLRVGPPLQHSDNKRCSATRLASWNSAHWPSLLAAPDRESDDAMTMNNKKLTVQRWPTPSWWSRWCNKSAGQRQFRYARVLEHFAIPHSLTTACIDSWHASPPTSFSVIEDVESLPWSQWLTQQGEAGIDELLSLLTQWHALFIYANDGEFDVQKKATGLMVHDLTTLAHTRSPRRYARAQQRMVIAMIKQLDASTRLTQQFASAVVARGWIKSATLTSLGIAIALPSPT